MSFGDGELLLVISLSYHVVLLVRFIVSIHDRGSRFDLAEHWGHRGFRKIARLVCVVRLGCG